jgi:adenylate kinase family enzyme
MARVHITGASGTGTSTLGAALAARLGHRHVDADSIYWLPTDPPFTTPRDKAARAALVGKLLPLTGAWVFSGSAPGWTTTLEPAYDLVVFLTLDPAIRMARLRRRETERYGPRVAAGGDMAEASEKFLTWAADYDVAGMEQRSRVLHEAWLKDQTAPILRLDASMTVDRLVEAAMARLDTLRVGAVAEDRDHR